MKLLGFAASEQGYECRFVSWKVPARTRIPAIGCRHSLYPLITPICNEAFSFAHVLKKVR